MPSIDIKSPIQNTNKSSQLSHNRNRNMKDTNPGNLDKKDSRNRHNDENQTVRLPQMTLN